MKNVPQSGRVTEQETKATSEGFNILHCTAVLMYSTVSLTISIGAIPSRLIKKKKELNESRVQEVAHKWKAVNYERSHFLIILLPNSSVHLFNASHIGSRE